MPVERDEFPDSPLVQAALPPGWQVSPDWALYSRQVMVDGTTYQVGDSVAADAGLWKLSNVVTLRVSQGNQTKEVTFVQGREYVRTGRQNPHFPRPIFGCNSETGSWFPASTLKRIVFAHHCCTSECSVQRICQHERCSPACPLASFQIAHSEVQEHYIEESYRVLS